MVYSIYHGLEFFSFARRILRIWLKEQVGYVGTEGLCRSLVVYIVEEMMLKKTLYSRKELNQAFLPTGEREGEG